MNRLALAAAAFLATAAAPASAVTLHYLLTGNDLDGTVEFASFEIDSNPIPLANNIGLGYGVRIKRLNGFFQYGTITATDQDVQFFNEDAGGGFVQLDPTDPTGNSAFIGVLGPQLYSGSEATPTFSLTGSFDVVDGFTGAPLKLNITAVPEPATWGMLTLGFAAVGGALRMRRRVRVEGVLSNVKHA